MKDPYRAVAWSGPMIGGGIGMEGYGFSEGGSYSGTAGLGGGAWGTLSSSSACILSVSGELVGSVFTSGVDSMK